MQAGNGKECISFDLRPSDAINMAVRCKVWFLFHWCVCHSMT